MKVCRPRRHVILARVALASGFLVAPSLAETQTREAHAKRVLVMSLDGLHAVDLARYVKAKPNSALAELARQGITYSNAWQPVGDSSPGLLAIATGGSGVSTGIIYSPTYDRALAAAGSNCEKRGTLLTIDNKLNKDLDAEDAGGGFDVSKLPRDPSNGCAPLYPHQLIRTNTIFELVKKSGGRTAWADQHIAYNDMLRGPSGTGLDESFALNGSVARAKGTFEALVDQDGRRVEAVLNQIRGFDASGKAKARVPTLFGVTMIAFSGMQKMKGHGYQDADATPSPGLLAALDSEDKNVGRIVAELKRQDLYDSTFVIVTAKHGQSPIDPKRVRLVNREVVRGAVKGIQKDLLAHFALDTVGLLWLTDRSRTPEVVAVLRLREQEAGIQKIYAGHDLDLKLPDDSRRPDIIIETEPGVIYVEDGTQLIAEHGGSGEEDAHVALLVVGAQGSATSAGTTFRGRVSLTQVAPTALEALGLDPKSLDAVRIEGTQALPPLQFAAKGK